MTLSSMPSRTTKKGQVTIPSVLRKQFHIEAGKSVEFEASNGVIMMKPIHDMVDSAGELSSNSSQVCRFA